MFKKKSVPVWELTEKEAEEYGPTFLDLWDDLPSHVQKYFTFDKVEKEIRKSKKEHKVQERQIAAAQARRAAKRLQEKHPKWTYKEIINHSSVKKHLPDDMRARSKRRILEEVLPKGKQGRPPKRKPRK